MAMTNEEKQEIIEEVLASLRVNSRTIDDLTAVQNITGSEVVEINGGRKISVRQLMYIIQEAVNDASVSPLTSRVGILETNVDNLQRDKFNKADIVEAEGNESSYVMSQRFVTQKIAEINTKLGNITVSLGVTDGNNINLTFTNQAGNSTSITLGKATTTKAGLLSAADKTTLNELDNAKVQSFDVTCNSSEANISIGRKSEPALQSTIPTAGTIPDGSEAPVAGVMSADQAADLADVLLQVFPLVASVSYSNAGIYEKGISVIPNVTIDVTRRGNGVATQVSLNTTLHVVDTAGNTPMDKIFLDYDALTENASFNISVSHRGMTVNLPQQQYRFVNYVYGEVIDEEPANIAATIFNATTLKELGTRTTYNGTLAADKMFVFAVPGNVNLVCRHSETGASISGCVKGQANVPRQNNVNITDLYSYIIVPASDIAWNFKIVNS